MIKYNERGEVVSVNGITTGHHIGKPMQDAACKSSVDNECYSREKNTVTNCCHTVVDKQPCVDITSDNINEYATGGSAGGSGATVVKASLDFETSSIVIDKTYAEILEMAKTSPVVIIFDTMELVGGMVHFNFQMVDAEMENALIFYSISPSYNYENQAFDYTQLSNQFLMVYPDGTIGGNAF